MSLTRFALERDRVTWIAAVLILAAGAATYLTMPRDEDPGFTVRTALVTTLLPGASPERVEDFVTAELEKAIQEMPEVDAIRSESRVGQSLVYVDVLESITEMRPVWDSLRRKVDKARAALPEDVVGPTVNDEFGDVFGTIVTVTGEGLSYAELEDLAEDVRDALLLIDDVAEVELHGVQEERVYVEYDNARLAELGLSPYEFASLLESRNVIIPGGSVQVANAGYLERIALEPTGNFESLEDLRRTVVALPGSDAVMFLEDIAEVRRGYVEPARTLVRSSGEPAIALAVSMREGGNIIRLGDEVLATLDRLRADLPIGVELSTVAFQAGRVSQKIAEFSTSLAQSVAIVFVSMLLFLGLRTGLVVASLIPLAIAMSVALMPSFGVGLDQMSLAALIISLGMLVDNAIVMSESVLVRMEAGEAPVDAALASARELQVPLLVATLTTAAAFLPIYLGESTTAEYTGTIFVVVALTLSCSWLLALTVVPLLCVKGLRVAARGAGAGGGAGRTRFQRAYRSALLAALGRPWRVVLGAAGVFALALFGFRLVPSLFFPPSTRAIATLELELPPGVALEQTSRVVGEVEEALAAEEAVVSWCSFIGSSAPRFILNYTPGGREPRAAFVLVNTTSFEPIPELVPRLERFCAERFPDLTADVDTLDYGPPVRWPVAVRVSGGDLERVFAHADAVAERLRSTPGVRLVDDDWGPRTKKLLVHVDQPRAYRAGVTSRDVAVSLQTMLTGLDTTTYREDDALIPVTMRSAASFRDDVDRIESLNVYSRAGRSVPLGQVADVEVAWQPSVVRRRDRLPTVTVQARLEPEVTASEVTADLVPFLEELDDGWAPGEAWELGGESETSSKARASIAAKLPIAAFVIVALLVGQFNSFRRTAIVLLTIPLGIIGVVVGLLVTGSYFGFMTLLGVISLAGIVINNAIVLLDRIRIEVDENGLAPREAILVAGERRLRPILLTTVTTAGGLLPLWLGPEGMFTPMAIAILFGLVFATVLTLGLVPVLYALLFRVSFRGESS